MTSTRSPSTSAKTRSATRRIESFRQRFGDGHFYLACHAALPLALTPDLLYSLWANFQRDIHGETIEIPWIAVADLMLSNLCKEVGNELYEMDKAVRDDLLNQLQNDSRFGLERLRALADFVMAYVEQQLDSSDLDTRDLAEAQRWRALAYKNPAASAHEIALALSRLSLADKTEWIRMAELLSVLVEPLTEFSSLLTYVSAMKDFAKGDKDGATTKFNQILDSTHSLRIAGVNLLVPESIEINQPQSQLNSPYPKILQINYFQRFFPWLITGSLTLGLTLVYFLQSNQPLANFLQRTQPLPSSSSVTASSPTDFPTAAPSADTTRQPTQVPSPSPSSTMRPSPSVVASLSPQPSLIKVNPSAVPNPSIPNTPTSVPNTTSPVLQPTEPLKPVSPTDRRTLFYGDNGSDVAKLQQQLRALGWDVPVDGIFGSSTRQAILDFQVRNGLAADGIPGPATRNALFNGVTAGIPSPILNPSTTSAPTMVPDIGSTPQPIQEGGLQIGDRGPAVTTLQDQLRSAGYYNRVSTGVYASITADAVRQFQSSQGLIADGVAGPVTRAALRGSTASVRKRYVVVVSIKSSDTLSQVRVIVPDAVYSSSDLGKYIWAGAFDERDAAEARATLLRTNKLDAQVSYF